MIPLWWHVILLCYSVTLNLYPQTFCLALHFITKQSPEQPSELALLQSTTSGKVRCLRDWKESSLGYGPFSNVPKFIKAALSSTLPLSKVMALVRIRDDDKQLLVWDFSILPELKQTNIEFVHIMKDYKWTEKKQTCRIILIYWFNKALETSKMIQLYNSKQWQ